MINNSSQCIFDIAHVLKNLRDTLDYVIVNKEHDVKVYEARKAVLSSVRNPQSFIGKFIDDNKDKLADFIKKYDEFLEEIYSDKSTVIVVANKTGPKDSDATKEIRVDHSQHIKIYDYIVNLSETIRDIMISHLVYAKNNNLTEEIIMNLITVEERFDRLLKTFLIMQDYNKSFAEFQKMMGESKGKATPQSNYMVQNELSPMATMMRFVRMHAHCTDNQTLDVLDNNIELIEMTEGRRDRRDNKPFSDFFKASLDDLMKYTNENVVNYQKAYDVALKEMIEAVKAAKEAQANKAAEA